MKTKHGTKEETAPYGTDVSISTGGGNRVRIGVFPGELGEGIGARVLAAMNGRCGTVETPVAIPMILTCPSCNARHVDKGEFVTKPHHTHSCQSCGLTWRPAVVPTVGVQFLPGFKDPT